MFASCRRARRRAIVLGVLVNIESMPIAVRNAHLIKTMQQLLKDWRQDAMHKHQFESAIYIGDKLLAITSKQVNRICKHGAHVCQMILTTPSSLPKSTFQPETIPARRASYTSMISWNITRHAGTWPPIARSDKANTRKLSQY